MVVVFNSPPSSSSPFVLNYRNLFPSSPPPLLPHLLVSIWQPKIERSPGLILRKQVTRDTALWLATAFCCLLPLLLLLLLPGYVVSNSMPQSTKIIIASFLSVAAENLSEFFLSIKETHLPSIPLGLIWLPLPKRRWKESVSWRRAEK